MAFKRYEFEDDKKKASSPPSSTGSIDKFKNHKFERDSSELILGVTETKVGRFKVHNLVEEQLGLVERESRKNEALIAKGIESRWTQVKEKAEVEGFTQGLSVGKNEAYKAEQPRIEERLKLLDTFLTDLASQRELIFRQNEKFLTDLLAQILRVIALKEIQLDPDYLQRLVMHLLDQISSTDDVRVLISDEDYENLERLQKQIDREKPEFKNLTFEFHPEVSKGSCRIETKSIVIDGLIEEQIRNAMTVLQQSEGSNTR